jgi:hypothetical protein
MAQIGSFTRDTDGSHHADAPQPASIERNIGAVRNKLVERQPSRPPFRIGRKSLAIRLPRPEQCVRPQMNAVLLTIAEYVEFDTAPAAGVDDASIRREIEGDLNKAAIVLDSDVATHADGGPAGDYVADHRPAGDSPHDLVGEEPPFAPYRGN